MRTSEDASSSCQQSTSIHQASVSRVFAALVFLSACLAPAALQAQQAKAQPGGVPSLITQPVNNARRVILRGNVHPLARPEFDQGLAPDSLPMQRMLLVLKRSPQQETALTNLLTGQQEKSSPQYHHWLTPQQFGQEFGPSDSDLQAVTDWLAAQGFEVNHVTKGRSVIEFSGSAGLVRKALHAEIHKYVVKGKSYWANSSNPQIPAALAPVVAGIASMNNFPRMPLYRSVGVFSRSKKTGKVKALYTAACPQGYTCSAPYYYALGPTDFATIYNVLPLWNAGTDGTGETIAIVSDSNINPQDVTNFRSMFGLPPKPVNIILDGPDPGIISGSETEADADVEWAGAVAKNATIDLVVSQDTEATAGIDLSALDIVDNNLAPVLSESYGGCEAYLGTAGNAFESAMWEQAAAEGITVTVASGDTGSAGCDYQGLANAASKGLAVSGMASTPFNVAVGGTDFDNPANYFNTTSDSTTQNSAKSYIPEIPWNDSCARAGKITDCSSVSSYGQDLVAGSGGVSNCAVKDSFGNCTSGYAKPAWQTGTGVPADGLRDVPDVSLFAGDGLDYAFYVICSSDSAGLLGNGSCSGDISTLDFVGVGGTSLSAPSFAGIMALLDQKTGQRQGNANFVLYPLAAAAAKSNDDCASDPTAVSNSACVFYDIIHGHNISENVITPGTNSVACVAGSPNCNAPAGYPFGIMVSPAGSTTPAWTTATGYDLATGLGSVNAANLVNNWGSVSFHSSGTTLNLSPTTLTHGQPVSATVSVTSSASTPTGDVELMGNPGGGSLGIATFKLGSGGRVSGTTNMLPGGTYNVFAHYAGDGTSGSSDSTPVQVTVNPENSQPQMSFVSYNPATGSVTGSNPTPPSVYGTGFYIMRIDILNSAGKQCSPPTSGGLQVQPSSACPTGTVTLTNNGSPVNDFGGSNSTTVNSQGYLEDQQLPLLDGGSYSYVANYSGDASFNPSSSTTNFTINPAPTTLTASVAPSSVQYGASVTFKAQVNSTSLGVCPEGTYTFFVDGSQAQNPITRDTCSTYNPIISPSSYASAGAQLQANYFTTLGTHTLSVQYSGDANYQAATSAVVNFNVTKYQPQLSVILNPAAITPGQQTTLEAVVDGSAATPSGTVTFYDGGTAISGTVTYSPPPGIQLYASLPYAPTTMGAHSITATYSGDSDYLSASGAATLTVSNPDFTLTNNGGIGTIKAGLSQNADIMVTPQLGWTGTVNLACAVTTTISVSAQYMPTCSLTPASVTVGANEMFVLSTLTVATTAPSLVPLALPPARWPPAVWLLLFGLLGLATLALSRNKMNPVAGKAFRWALSALLVTLVLGVALWGSCGGGAAGGGPVGGSTGNSNGSGSTTTTGTPAGTYMVTVTGTSGSLSHQTTMQLTVQ